MTTQLTVTERNAAALSLLALIALGVLAAVIGDSGLFRFQVWVTIVYSLAVLVLLIMAWREPLPTYERF